jgi:hypothetical protein
MPESPLYAELIAEVAPLPPRQVDLLETVALCLALAVEHSDDDKGISRARASEVMDRVRFLAARSPRRARFPGPRARGTAAHPCEDCGQTTRGNTRLNGWYRCNSCGYPGK